MERHDHPTGTMPPAPPYEWTSPQQQPPEPERPKWSTRRTTAVTAVAAAAVLAVGGVAVANSAGSDPATAEGGPGGGQFGGGFRGGGTGLAGALHGTFVSESDGSYVTRLLQTGDVTAVSATSITVKSTDGYTKTYALSSSTTVNAGQSQLDAIRTGHTVTVIATDSAAATTITDQSLTTPGQNGSPGGFPGPPGRARRAKVRPVAVRRAPRPDGRDGTGPPRSPGGGLVRRLRQHR